MNTSTLNASWRLEFYAALGGGISGGDAPLGLDPGLPKLLADRAAHLARECGFPPEAFTVILLAHGSRLNPSRKATE